MRASILATALLIATASSLAATLEEAKALFEDRRIPQARAAFEALARSGPSRAEASFYLGRLADIERDPENAAKHYEAAAALDPKNARYRFWAGRAYRQVTHGLNVFRAVVMTKKAQRAFEDAVRLDPSYVEARAALIDFYLSNADEIGPFFVEGAEQKARAQLAAIEKLDPAYAHFARVRFHRRAEKPELVTREYEAAVRRFPNDPRSHIWFSTFRSEQGRWDAAIREAAEAVRVDPSYMPGYFQVGHVAVASGKNLEAGEAALRKYLTYVPKDDEPTITMARFQLGLLYEKLGRNAEALAQLKEAERRWPDFWPIRSALERVRKAEAGKGKPKGATPRPRP
ncbi:MAG TPA: tetratricopeptide repeat protein [Thermoanaerobaculia bacterium]|nr:tetratricopeptide repeat protein [Thermoanaerobaculia bacterium]